MTGKKKINLVGEGGVLALVNKPGAVFSVKFRKTDGNISVKVGCTRLPTTNGLGDQKQSNRSGLLRLYQPAIDHTFDVYIDCLVEFNEMTVVHPY
ncbi:hypothetical protein [Arsenicibacter rosenii]|uniref:Uncharacterized protein n=1 Tax=Arsenicibacter rosenii TaxID=1750698 RepID=A0A1S2VQX7_9BACT|nr:hypothetical protein [Arsenicibacter rosenii]OIN61171.1 hypothetical protein BLX24_03680 [Arsenicibacter rosenii]